MRTQCATRSASIDCKAQLAISIAAQVCQDLTSEYQKCESSEILETAYEIANMQQHEVINRHRRCEVRHVEHVIREMSSHVKDQKSFHPLPAECRFPLRVLWQARLVNQTVHEWWRQEKREEIVNKHDEVVYDHISKTVKSCESAHLTIKRVAQHLSNVVQPQCFTGAVVVRKYWEELTASEREEVLVEHPRFQEDIDECLKAGDIIYDGGDFISSGGRAIQEQIIPVDGGVSIKHSEYESGSNSYRHEKFTSWNAKTGEYVTSEKTAGDRSFLDAMEQSQLTGGADSNWSERRVSGGRHAITFEDPCLTPILLSRTPSGRSIGRQVTKLSPGRGSSRTRVPHHRTPTDIPAAEWLDQDEERRWDGRTHEQVHETARGGDRSIRKEDRVQELRERIAELETLLQQESQLHERTESSRSENVTRHNTQERTRANQDIPVREQKDVEIKAHESIHVHQDIDERLNPGEDNGEQESIYRWSANKDFEEDISYHQEQTGTRRPDFQPEPRVPFPCGPGKSHPPEHHATGFNPDLRPKVPEHSTGFRPRPRPEEEPSAFRPLQPEVRPNGESGLRPKVPEHSTGFRPRPRPEEEPSAFRPLRPEVRPNGESGLRPNPAERPTDIRPVGPRVRPVCPPRPSDYRPPVPACPPPKCAPGNTSSNSKWANEFSEIINSSQSVVRHNKFVREEINEPVCNPVIPDDEFPPAVRRSADSYEDRIRGAETAASSDKASFRDKSKTEKVLISSNTEPKPDERTRKMHSVKMTNEELTRKTTDRKFNFSSRTSGQKNQVLTHDTSYVSAVRDLEETRRRTTEQTHQLGKVRSFLFDRAEVDASGPNSDAEKYKPKSKEVAPSIADKFKMFEELSRKVGNSNLPHFATLRGKRGENTSQPQDSAGRSNFRRFDGSEFQPAVKASSFHGGSRPLITSTKPIAPQTQPGNMVASHRAVTETRTPSATGNQKTLNSDSSRIESSGIAFGKQEKSWTKAFTGLVQTARSRVRRNDTTTGNKNPVSGTGFSKAQGAGAEPADEDYQDRVKRLEALKKRRHTHRESPESASATDNVYTAAEPKEEAAAPVIVTGYTPTETVIRNPSTNESDQKITEPVTALTYSLKPQSETAIRGDSVGESNRKTIKFDLPQTETSNLNEEPRPESEPRAHASDAASFATEPDLVILRSGHEDLGLKAPVPRPRSLKIGEKPADSQTAAGAPENR